VVILSAVIVALCWEKLSWLWMTLRFFLILEFEFARFLLRARCTCAAFE
jgi:hypothetical protein